MSRVFRRKRLDSGVPSFDRLEKMKDGNRMQEKDGHGIIIKYHDHNRHRQNARLTPCYPA